MPRFTVDAGRHILKDGEPFIYIGRAEYPKHSNQYVPPSDVDQITHKIVALLNAAEVPGSWDERRAIERATGKTLR